MADNTADTDWIDCHALRRDAQARGSGRSEPASGLGTITLATRRCTTLRLVEPDGSTTEIPIETVGSAAKDAAKAAERLKAAEAEAAARALEEEEARAAEAAAAAAKAKAEAERKAKAEAEAEARAKAEAEEKARLAAEAKAKKEAEEQARREAEAKAKAAAEAKAKAKAEAEEKARAQAEEKARAEAEKKVRREAEEKARKEAEEKARLEAERKAKAEAEAKAKAEAEEKARREAEAKAKREAEAKAAALAKAKAEAEAKAKKEAEEKARREAEAKAKKEAEEKAKREAEEKAKREAAEKARREAEAKAKAEAERKAKAEAERKAKEAAEKKAKEEAERKAKAEAEKKAKQEAERKAKEEAEAAAAKAKAEAEQKAKKEAEAKAAAEAAEQARKQAEEQAAADALAKAENLGQTFRRLIRETGPISLAHYMAESNARYYTSRDPLGEEADFITAPEVSQMFGELIGLWLTDLWVRMGARKRIHYVELGPGRGTLATDALRTGARYDFDPQIHFVETSPALRKLQLEAFPQATHHNDLSTLPDDAPLLIVANEFFDALPIHQLIRSAQGWHERMVGLEGDDFAFVAGDKPMDTIVPKSWKNAPQGSMIETSAAASAVMEEIANRLTNQGGAALIIDYGAFELRSGSTLQAIRNHEKVDVFAHPGQADLTAHVDFEMLKDVAEKNGADVMGVQMQGEWLRQMGIDVRHEALQRKNPADGNKLRRQYNRLVDDGQMGTLFKVLGVCGRRWPMGVGFD